MFKVLLLLASFLVLSPAFATSRNLNFSVIEKVTSDKLPIKYPDEYYQVTDIVVEEVSDKAPVNNPPQVNKSLDEIIVVVDKLIAIGKKVWPLIKDNEPVIDLDFMNVVSVLPFQEGSKPSATFYEMSNWSLPKSKTYSVVYKNALGMSVVEFDYIVSFQYGGQHDGQGAYLTSINVIPGQVSVLWGFEFNASSHLISITNHGEAKDPQAGATFQIDYKAETVLRKIQSKETFHVTGNGKLIKL